jgi:hypothetical protein
LAAPIWVSFIPAIPGAAFILAGIRSTSIWWKIIDEVNAVSPAEHQLNYYNSFSNAKVLPRHRELFPEREAIRMQFDKSNKLLWTLLVVTFLVMVVSSFAR